MLANSLTLGCDCLGAIRYFDAVADRQPGRAAHDRERHLPARGGLRHPLEAHRPGAPTRPRCAARAGWSSRSISTVGNYEYGFYWYFYQDGTIQFEVKLTGIINTAGAARRASTRLRHRGGAAASIAHDPPAHLQHAPRHGGRRRGATAWSRSTSTTHGSRARTTRTATPSSREETLLATEQAARRRVDSARARYWKIVNPTCAKRARPAHRLPPDTARGGTLLHLRAGAGQPARRLHPQPALGNAVRRRRALFAPGATSTRARARTASTAWTEQDRTVEDTDIVVWHSFGHHHLPRPEDFPVQPVVSTGFTLQPFGFFDRNPALDVPPATSSRSCQARRQP